MRAEHCFAYLIADADAREAALVDPRADRVEDYLRDLDARGRRLRFVIETHTHADHISGAAELRARTGAEVLLSARATSEVATSRLRDGDRVVIGGHAIHVLESPGHTDDSISLLVGGALLMGDALLVGGAGRTDFQNGSPEALYETLHGRFAALSGALTVYPGHDYAGRTHSMLSQERQTNALLRLTERDRFVSTLRAARQPKPANIRGLRLSPRITVEELAAALGGQAPPVVVDVRLPAEYHARHLEPSRLLPLDQIARRRDELPRDRELVLVCRTGSRARLAAAELAGFRTRVLEGGLVAWQQAGHPVVEGTAHMSLERQVRIAAGTLAGVRRRAGGGDQPVVRPGTRIRGRGPRVPSLAPARRPAPGLTSCAAPSVRSFSSSACTPARSLSSEELQAAHFRSRPPATTPDEWRRRANRSARQPSRSP